MIRFHRLHQVATRRDKDRLAMVLKLYQDSFSYSPEYAKKIARLLAPDPGRNFEVVFLIAEGAKSRVLGFSLSLYFTDLKLAYIDYLISDPGRAGRGIGSALYEATRELYASRGCRGMFMDVPPDEKSKLRETFRLDTNRKRMKFYEKFNALPIVNTEYDILPTPANEGHPTFLVYDHLAQLKPLRLMETRKFVSRLLEIKGGMGNSNPKKRQILASFRDDPVQLRPPRYQETLSAPIVRRHIGKIDIVNAGNAHQIHHLKEKGYVERPSRIDFLLKGIEKLFTQFHKVREFPMGPIRAVHEAGLINFLAKAAEKLSPRDLLYPNVFPIRRPERIPKTWEMQAGYYCIDTFTPLTAKSFLAARQAVNGSLTGAELLLNGSSRVYVLCRPPGHHAERKVFGGFCYLNNAAIAAHHLSRRGKVALIDIDYHHGNGSQNIFYDRSDVLFVSLHGHPLQAYPYFSGFADEKGEKDGLGFNRNFPLKPGSEDLRYLTTLEKAASLIRNFRPEFLVVSVGYDIMKGDPTGTFNITRNGMQRIGEILGALRLPTLMVQEGGYALANLKNGSRSFLTGIARD